jgi:Rrf2 family iron-sulfur cluster assembly transcriptional regulator
MRLTTKGQLAVTAMLDLAMQNSSDPVTLAEISQRQKISLSYLEQLFGRMRRRALVNSVRGPGGGKENCHDDKKCITHDPWAKLNEHIFDYLGAVPLKQLVGDQKAKQNGVAQVQDMRETLPKRDRTTVAV